MKYSKQREMIYNELLKNPVHPTAETIYQELKPANPSLSLGTVYRNLGQLAENGIIVKISMPDAGDRYDGNTKPHHHLLCRECGQLDDVACDIAELERRTEQRNGCKIEASHLVFVGVCRDCIEGGRTEAV